MSVAVLVFVLLAAIVAIANFYIGERKGKGLVNG